MYRLNRNYVENFTPEASGWREGNMGSRYNDHRAFLEALAGCGDLRSWTRGSLIVSLMMEGEDVLHAAYINGHVVDLDVALQALETAVITDTKDLYEGLKVLYMGLPAEIVSVPADSWVRLTWNHTDWGTPMCVGLDPLGRSNLDAITLLDI